MRALTFIGKAPSIYFAPHLVIRISPALHAIGALPPLPPIGCTVPIDTPRGRISALILASARDRLLIRASGKRWGLSPPLPNEVDGRARDPEELGATDWVIRPEA